VHRAAVVAAIALLVVLGSGRPSPASAAGDPGDWYDDPVVDADVVLIGTAHDAGAGRVVNGCQLTAATVLVEEVLLGELPTPAPTELTVEFVGDCATVGTLGEPIPTERAIWFLVNKGAWLRENVLARSGNWSSEDAYWRPLEPDAITVDHEGSLEKYASELRESAYMRPEYEPEWPPVGLGIWFTVQSWLAAAAAGVVALLAAVWALIVRGNARRFGLAVAGLAAAGGCLAIIGGPRLARTVDFTAGIAGRTAVVEALRGGTLKHLEYDDYAVPSGLEGLARGGVVQATAGPPAMAFFLTQVFFSPDPYCGYEYAQVPEALVLDPLGSGGGGAEDLGDGWYWVCAS
jgi:hypothetical protein